VSQVTSDSFDTLHNTGNGDSRSSSRSLMIRDHESQALSQYMMPGSMSPFGNEPTAQGLNFVQLLHALRRRWLLALCTGLMVGVPLAAIVWLITPDNYEVVAWLQVGDDPASVLNKGGFSRRDPTEYEQFRKTQSALIKSPNVLRMALNDSAIANLPVIRDESEPVEFLKEEISVAFPLESEVLQIKMRGKDRKQLVQIVNAVKDSYLENVVAVKRQETNRTYELLEKEVKANRADILEKQTQLQRLAEQLQSQDVHQARVRSELLMGQSHQKLGQLREAESQLARLEASITVAEKRQLENSGAPEHLVEAVLNRDEMIAGLSQRLATFQEALSFQEKASRHPDRDPAVKRLRQQVSDLRQSIDERKTEIRPMVEKHVLAELDQQGGMSNEPKDLESKKTMFDTLKQQVSILRKEYEDVAKEAANATTTNADLKTREDEIKGKLELTRDLEGQLQRLSLAIRLDPRVTELMPASEPEGTNPLLRYFLTVFAAIVGLAVGAGGVVAMEYQARRVNSTTDLSIGAGLRVLGTVPNISKLSSSKGLNGSAALQGILAESVDSIRTMLLTRDDPPRAVIVTSAGDREGKTTVATHLAASLARSGRRTLLVDGDLRSPSIHAMFNAAPEPGVCEVLRGEADFEGVLQPTSVDGLMLVAAGQCDYQCIAALAKDRFKDFVTKAREQFEYVIIDAAPVLTYADMLLMGAHVDAAVLSVRRDVSQMYRVYEARERMESVDIRVLGAVVNGISETSRRPAYALPAGG
jgi:polysaccharide biosynthesis transport protein